MSKVNKEVEVHVVHHYEKPQPKIRYRKPKAKKFPIKKIISVSANIIELVMGMV